MRRLRAAWWLLGLVFLVVAGIWLSAPARVPCPTPAPAASVPLDLDPFTATPAELCLLPGIGPRLARRLHREIHRQGLTRLDQLTEVVGIGPGRVEAIRTALSSRRGR